MAGLAKVAFNAVVARAAGAAEVGEVNIALATALALAIPLEFAAGGTQKFVAERLGGGARGGARHALAAGLALTALAALALGLAGGLAIAAGVDGLGPALLALAVMQAFATLAKRSLFAIGASGRYAALEGASLVAFAIALAVVLPLRGAWLLVPFAAQYAVFLAGAALLLGRATRGWPKETAAAGAVRAVARYGLLALTGYAAALGLRYAATIVTGAWAGSVEAGYYAAAFSVALPLAFLPVLYQQVALPHVARLHGAGEAAAVEAFTVDSYRLVGAAMAVAAALLFATAPLLAPLLFGPGFTAATGVLQVLAAAAFVEASAAPLVQALHGTRHVRVAVAAGAAQVAAGVVAWLLLVPRLGALGAALGLLAGAVALSACYHLAAARWLRFPLRAAARPVVGFAAAAGAGLVAGPLAALVVVSVAFVPEARRGLALLRAPPEGAAMDQ